MACGQSHAHCPWTFTSHVPSLGYCVSHVQWWGEDGAKAIALSTSLRVSGPQEENITVEKHLIHGSNSSSLRGGMKVFQQRQTDSVGAQGSQSWTGTQIMAGAFVKCGFAGPP